MAAPEPIRPVSPPIEVTAIDNSIYLVTLSPNRSLRPNRHYTKSYELSLDEFKKLSDEFEAEIPVLELQGRRAPDGFMTGIADRVGLLVGRGGPRLRLCGKDRMQEPDMTMNFMMLLNSGTQRRPAKMMCNFDRISTAMMTQEGIFAATWTDVSDRFDMEKPVHGVDPGYPPPALRPNPPMRARPTAPDWFSGEGNSC